MKRVRGQENVEAFLFDIIDDPCIRSLSRLFSTVCSKLRNPHGGKPKQRPALYSVGRIGGDGITDC